eukprot:TRINITY_DN0_c264_g1_i3.p1 TRINITY_DN0_c264_g1~~TRINITY_DN0_c264_g1_i3.p1  ORF type:complete len:149 (-),score=54.68 TRINITY_DN0_c264_g1_i3:47-493(-)
MFINEFAASLEKSGNFAIPKWVDFVKTGVQKELAPYNDNWLFVRAASIARRIYLHGMLGVNTLRTMYGSKNRKGTAGPHFRKSDAKVIRYCTCQLKKMGYLDLIIDKVEDDNGNMIDLSTKGKVITKKARAEMDKIATEIYKKLHPRN